jgi:hypothetical protein
VVLAALVMGWSGIYGLATMGTVRDARANSVVAPLTEVTGLAHVPSTSPGFACASFAAMGTAKAGIVRSVSVHLDGYLVTYSATMAHLDGGLFAYPGPLEVSLEARRWVLPHPVDPKDEYFELIGLCAVQFAPGSHPEVLAEGFWGGAHCCVGPTLYGYAGTVGSYRVVEDLTKPGGGEGLHWDPNGGFEPEKIGGTVVLASSDGAFPYAFGCYACTPAPMRLFTVVGARLLDVTDRYPDAVRSEAKALWDGAAQQMRSPDGAGSVEGPLAAWAADECELNQGAQMWRALEQLQAQGRLTAAEKQSFGNKGPFPPQLKAFLLKNGYCRGQL